jgi:hypothetical protein
MPETETMPEYLSDECLREQYEALDAMSEKDVRLCAKKAYYDMYQQLRRDRELTARAEEEKKRLMECIYTLENKIGTRDQRLREFFDL